MTKTRSEVIAMAHRRLGLLSADETPTGDMDAFAREVLAGLLAEVQAAQGMTYAWAEDPGNVVTIPDELGSVADDDSASVDVPDSLFLPLAYLLAVEIAPHYEIAPRDSRAALISRLRAQAFPDDREDPRDLDDDGTISDEEADAGLRAAYY